MSLEQPEDGVTVVIVATLSVASKVALMAGWLGSQMAEMTDKH